MTAVLVTLPQLKEHLRITWDEHNSRLQSCLDRAEGIVLNHCKVLATDSPLPEWWDDENLRANVNSAILLTAQALYSNQPFKTQTFMDLLYAFRVPTVA